MATPLFIVSTDIVNVVPPVSTPPATIQPLHIVAPAVPVPTLVDGRPQ